MFPITDSAPRAAEPLLVYALIMINTFVFVWLWSLPPRALELVTIEYALVPLRYTDPIDARAAGLNPDDWWPLVTNTFMHGGWLHLILNMWTLWIFGPAMEARFGGFGDPGARRLRRHRGGDRGLCGDLPARARAGDRPARLHLHSAVGARGAVRADLVRHPGPAGHPGAVRAFARRGCRLVGPYRRLCIRRARRAAGAPPCLGHAGADLAMERT